MIQAIKINFPNGETMHWDFSFSRQGTMRLGIVYPHAKVPEWVKLEKFQCPVCTLKPEESPVCPVAEVMAKYAFDLADRNSHEQVEVQIFQSDGSSFLLSGVSLQRVAGELVRLGAFQYGCPIGRKFKRPMSELPPFPTNEEILGAFTRAYVETAGEWASELELVEDLHDLFGNLSIRFDQVGRGDAHLNGVLILHSLSVLFSLSAPDSVCDLSEPKGEPKDG